MEINYQQNFTSKLNPIKPFSVNTKQGRVYIKEISQKEIKKSGFIRNLTVMFSKNFASLTNDPGWLIINNPNEKEKAAYIIKDFIKYAKSKLLKPDENLTLLAVFDKNKKLQGACMSFGLDDAPGCKKSTCYIESIGINKKYRGEGLGKILINKTLSSAKKSFTDVFLTGENLALGFYEKLGFKHLDPKDKVQKTVIDFIAQDRDDYPKYVSFLTKPLQPDKQRWYVNAAKKINEINKKS